MRLIEGGQMRYEKETLELLKRLESGKVPPCPVCGNDDPDKRAVGVMEGHEGVVDTCGNCGHVWPFIQEEDE